MTRPAPSSPAARAASAWPVPKRWQMPASTSWLADLAEKAGRRPCGEHHRAWRKVRLRPLRYRRSRQPCRARRCRHRAPSAASTASSTMPAWARWCAATCSTSAREFRRRHGHQPARHGVPQPGRRQRDARPRARRQPTLDRHDHLRLAPRWSRRSATEYCISKAGLSMAMKDLALRLAPEGIAVFEVRPGIIRTDMTAGSPSAYDEAIAAGLVPARRWGEATDVGARGAQPSPRGNLAFATGTSWPCRRRPVACRGCERTRGGHGRLHHRRRRPGRLCARQPAERGSGEFRAAARGGRHGLAPAVSTCRPASPR